MIKLASTFFCCCFCQISSIVSTAMAWSLIIVVLSITGSIASDITHCDGFSAENNTCSQTCFQLPCTMRCSLSNTKHDKCEQQCLTRKCDLMECEGSESCTQYCVGSTCNSMVCRAEVCSQDCTAGKCDMICSSEVTDCEQSCIAANYNFKCDAKNCKLNCFPGTCNELKSYTGRYSTRPDTEGDLHADYNASLFALIEQGK